MKTVNLEKIWQLLNTISTEQSDLSEKNIFVNFLGNSSNYNTMSFKSFLGYYNFKIDEDVITVFNDQNIPYEDYTNNDFSYLPIKLLFLTSDEVSTWLKNETQRQLDEQKASRLRDIEIKIETIKRLQDELGLSN